MCNIDYILDLLDWNQSLENQRKGLELARQVRSINVFLQPVGIDHNKNVWDNCALVLSDRSDEELTPYLVELMEWLQDMNCPGAFVILERLNKFEKNALFEFAFNRCVSVAKALNDEIWLNNLRTLKND